MSKFKKHLLGGGQAFKSSTWFDPDDIEEIRHTFFQEGSSLGGPWDRYREAHMRLPDWFQQGLDPWSDEYAAQQHRLWSLITGVERPYDPDNDEKESPWGDIDPVRYPGFYNWRGPQAMVTASDHVLATGMILKHCGLQAGDWAMEYGAGFGHTALTLSRLGVNVDTVDISATFCDFVRRQAEHFQFPLQAFQGHFGVNPRPGQKYKLIWFYESFHHCLDFKRVVPLLEQHLEEGGRILMGGEPIEPKENVAVPYPWGVRLHSEVTAVMRQTHWFELGFSEPFLFELFGRSGFVGRRIDCEPSLFGRLHIFERKADLKKAKPGSVFTVEELLALDGEQFINGAYLAALKRSPDEGGRKNYLAKLEGGATKAAILIDLAVSDEGRAAKSDFPGLRDLLRR
ncbi:MAG: methyltransferase domain-containing protein [Pseudomonadota bacterium]